ncbi:UNVERIFIED_CONTAM: hypothetical protein Slati_3772800 [Sesamum latifolium]|uniref:Reverse transcriptase zinc-binding domain-containing protein n=1 Tax=Sesamum latifolium TaxID=2727402 RepID=A0AAW2U3B4_9LAMI
MGMEAVTELDVKTSFSGRQRGVNSVSHPSHSGIRDELLFNPGLTTIRIGVHGSKLFLGPRLQQENTLGLGLRCKSKEDGGLGFKRLRLQNLALLAKQAWRIVVNSQGLAHSVLRARYFPDNSFFLALPVSNPSFTWRSILAARPLLMGGIRWKVGDGRLINVMNDPWLSRPPTFKIIAHPKSLPPSATVSELLTEDRSWNRDLVEQEFSSLDAVCILQSPISQAPNIDTLCWHFDAKGVFSVRSAYSLAQKGAAAAGTSAGGGAGVKGKWRFIWEAKVLPKVRLFAWRCCKNALPTHRSLMTRGVYIEGNYLCCNREEDGLDHVLRRCSFVRLVWGLSNLSWMVISRDDLSVEDGLRYVHTQLGPGDFERFLVIAHLLWGNRNSRMFEGRVVDAKSLIEQAYRTLHLLGF